MSRKPVPIQIIPELIPGAGVIDFQTVLPLYYLDYDELSSPARLGALKNETMYVIVRVKGKSVAGMQEKIGTDGHVVKQQSSFNGKGFSESIDNALAAAKVNQSLPSDTYEPRLIFYNDFYALWLKSNSGENYFYEINFMNRGLGSMRFQTQAEFSAEVKSDMLEEMRSGG